MQIPDKNRPSPEWISALRQRFTTEKEIDHILTNRLHRRSGPSFAPLSLETLVAGVEALIRADIGDHFSVRDARWLAGGASKLQMAFHLEWHRPGVGYETTAMVLRMEPAESIVATSRLREYQLLKEFQGIVPVPPVFWSDPEGEYLPHPALVYGFVPGVTKPSNAGDSVTGVGTLMTPELRAPLAEQFVDNLCKIHRHDFRNGELKAFDVPLPGTQCAEWCINWWDRVWEEDCDEEIPLMRVASAWMRRNLPSLDFPTVVHADYRTGNFMFTEHDKQFTAILDWELGRIGDRHQDLAWTTSRAFGSLAEDGKTFLVSGMMPEEEFFESYQKVSGFGINPKTIHWYKVFNIYTLATMTTATGVRAARNGKTHQDILVAWLIGLGNLFLEEIRALIEKGC